MSVAALGLALLQAAVPAAPQASGTEMIFRGPDGKPLPDDVQRQLRAQFKDAPPRPRPSGDGDIVVTGERPRGSALGDIPPERTLSAIDIRSYGANTVAELIQALGQQVSSARGRDDAGPIVLLNGRRVASFQEIARIPTEAIERTEILPEEVALKYGYPADQKVVNVVAFERFTSRIAQASVAAPTEGGQASVGGGGSYFRIAGETRVALDADVSRASALLESERGVAQPAGDPLLGTFRTLLPAVDRATINGTIAGTPIREVSASLNARFETNTTRALVGRGVDAPLRRRSETDVAHLGTQWGGRAGRWSWTAIANLDRTTADTTTDTGSVVAPRNDARFVNTLGEAELLFAGSPFRLPAGSASASIRVGAGTRDVDSTSRLGSDVRRTALGRDAASLAVNLDLPILARGALGRLSANVNAEVERLSGAGTLRTLGYGIAWVPTAAVSLLGSVTHENGAPSVEQLGAPTIVVPNVRTFDLVRGESVDVTRVLGGNSALRSDDRHVASVGLSYKPWAKTDLVLNIDYVRTRIDDPISAFPLPTPALEAAFPERIVRDGGGRLTRIDATPLNFARIDRGELRWGLSFVKPLGPLPPGVATGNVRVFSSEAEARRRAPPGAQVMMRRVEPGSPEARRFDNLTSRLTLSLQHSWRLEEIVQLRRGGPTLDLLDGGALDARGGRPRHEIEVQAGAYKRGLGARLTAMWQSGTRVDAAGASGDLEFSSLATVNLNMFADVTQYLGPSRTPSWLRGTRISLNAINVLNTRQDVRDIAGATPLAFQSAYLNPLGRSVAIGLRKIFR